MNVLKRAIEVLQPPVSSGIAIPAGGWDAIKDLVNAAPEILEALIVARGAIADFGNNVIVYTPEDRIEHGRRLSQTLAEYLDARFDLAPPT